MEFGQKFGWILLTGIPAFVGAGFLYDIFGSIKIVGWMMALAWIAVMYYYTISKVTGKSVLKRAK